MKSKKLFDKLILNNNSKEIIIPWKSILIDQEIDSINDTDTASILNKSISISCWIYMLPLSENSEIDDNNNRINRIFSQLQNNQIDSGIFLGNQSFDKRLYNDSNLNRTSIESVYYKNIEELKYYNWQFLIFKLNFNDDGSKLVSNEIYLNCKIYKQTNFNNSNKPLDSGNSLVSESSLINTSTYPLIIGSNDLSHQIILSDLTVHFNDRHDILTTLFQNISTIQPQYPPNIQNKSLSLTNSTINIIKPINSLLELINWNLNSNNNNNQLFNENNNSNNNNNNNINISTIKLEKRKNNYLNTKRIHCNDLMNGYKMDKFSQGIYSTSLESWIKNSGSGSGGNGSSGKSLWNGELYNFYHWNLIDIFIYFSHHRISIPPVGWINTAHKNGVKVLGTIILEWDQSLPDAYLLVDGVQENINIFIEKLIQISSYYKFDGWFLNLETCLLDDPIYVEKYQSFLKNLTNSINQNYLNNKQQQQQHDDKDYDDDDDGKPLIIWYDSVIQDGQLNWQNELNQNNIKFFNNCDGIFLNYCWKKDSLKTSSMFANNPNSSGIDRSKDVYVGTDVWGRGTFGGGGLNTWIGLKEADSYQLSSAIFAPGWTFENTFSSNKMVIEKERSLWLGSTIRNLVENGSGENGDFSTWIKINNNNNNNNDRYRWIIDSNGLLNGNGKSFKCSKSSRYDSSFFNTFKKRLDLVNNHGYSKEILDQLPIIEFEFYFKSSNNQNDSNNYPVNLIFLDENLSVLKEFNTQCLSIENDIGVWKKYKLIIKEYPIGIRFIDIIISGNNNCEISITGINLQIIVNTFSSSSVGSSSSSISNLDGSDDNGCSSHFNSIRSVTDERISICKLPFSSSFNRGKGKKYWRNGKLLTNFKWFNLSDQDVTGCEEDFRYQHGSPFIISSTSYSVSFNGGSSLHIKGKIQSITKIGNNLFNQISSNDLSIKKNYPPCGLNNNFKYSISSLFKTDINFNNEEEDDQQQLLISYTWTPKSISSKLCLILVFSDKGENNFKNIILHPSTLGDIDNKQQIFPFSIDQQTNNQNEYIIYESDQDEIINGHLNWYQSKFCLNISDFIFINNNNNNNNQQKQQQQTTSIKLKEIKSFSYNLKSFNNNNKESSITTTTTTEETAIASSNIKSTTTEPIIGDENEIDNNSNNGKLDEYNVYIGEITLDTITANNNNKPIIEIISYKIDQVWNSDSLSNGLNTNQELYDIILNWEYICKNNNNNNNNHKDNIIKCTDIYFDNKWIGRSYNNNYYIIKSKSISSNSLIKLELIDHLNTVVCSKDFKLYD